MQMLVECAYSRDILVAPAVQYSDYCAIGQSIFRLLCSLVFAYGISQVLPTLGSNR